MKSAIAIAVTLLISISLAFAEETPEKLFRNLETRIAQAAIAKDATQLNKLYASDYISVGGAGQIWSKAEVIDSLTSGRRAITAAQVEKITVRQYADTAIVVGTLTMSGKDGDKDITGRYAFTRVYKRDSGEWHAVSFQSTPVK
jgi:ketosteroid isomerase-like protein